MIGIFDSGSGGLTVLKAIREEMPSSDVVYFGDIKNAPYGNKSREELSQHTINAISFLKDKGASSIVSACNSVSASLSLSLLDAFSFAPNTLIEMVGPTVSMFKGTNHTIALVATPATIRSEIYQNAFRMIGKEVTTIPIPALASAIENGEPSETLDAIVADAVPHISADEYSTLVLACTHYPLALSAFKKNIDPKIAIIDPALAVARRVKKQLWPMEVGDGKTHLYITQDSNTFRALVADLFPESAGAIEVIQ
ncbi:hypothetical protein COU15_01350 [Candidatus Kaiserbacteria bacterium CG10_big_fil_rev_8_21_14_0_10_45_20]|uniref:Uncharacterized protein n=1 Tax=Candidatus Kaiserbacteria bacterium CG10_big_fil_rev_8_21_14_0_10_45_20 TaxID=1974607 RepID=A0A2H0UFV1_9BACT|nr:MAG: hypothetical protein COU15_01350 [Candidatus Kaiserbacteria bacterium CG10_big_fil_rev_8_21_14_0_10_45_20]